MKAYFSAALACLAAAGSAHAYPPYMDIGTFGAMFDQPTCCVRIPFNGIADAFYDAAKKSHIAVDASTSLSVPIVTRPLNRTGYSVTHSILRPNSQREVCDFLYYAGHGIPGEINTVDETAPLPIPPNIFPAWKNLRLDNGEFMFGGWIRWVYFNACSVMDGDVSQPGTWTKWNKAFNGGAQVVLSFRNFTWFNDMDRQHNTAKLFWKKWTGTAENSAGVYKRVDLGWNIYDAHVLSVTEGIYNASNRSLNTTPSLVTSNFARGYHEWLYYQNNGEASGRYKADRFLWKELAQAQ